MIILFNIVQLYRANVRSGDTDLLKFMSNIELNVWDKVMVFVLSVRWKKDERGKVFERWYEVVIW